MLNFHAASPRFRTNWLRVSKTIGNSPQLNGQMRDVAEDMRATAERVYRSQEIGTGTGAARNAFVARRFKGGWAVVLADDKARWIEAGAHAGGVTPVLAYRPMRAAMDRGETMGARVRTGRGIMSPRTRRM